MEIYSATFITSSPAVEDCPKNGISEYAFIGRSNVGKSSLINMLTGQKKLAKTSSTPGKTQLINHFLINEAWYLVDLPGYGYAKTSKKNKRTFQRRITSYFLKRPELITAFVLIDSRHKPQKIDLAFMVWLGQNNIPFSIIFTKTDKLKPGVLHQNVEQYKSVLAETWNPLPTYFLTSSTHHTGKEQILNYIGSLQQHL